MGLSINTRQAGEVTVIDLSGRLIFENCHQLREAVKAALAAGKRKIVVNLSQTIHCDSAGLGCIASSFASAQNIDGDLKLAGANPKVSESLRLTRLVRVINVYPTEKEALASFE